MGIDEDHEKAFNELLYNYPDAYATGIVIAERALRSAIMRDTGSAEKYYTMLDENENFSNIVTDRGTEAMPNLQNYLAFSYIQEGRFEEAQELIESLETNYPNSYVFMRGPNFRPRLQPVQHAVDRLRGQMQ
jgi:hypothetical protein